MLDLVPTLLVILPAIAAVVRATERASWASLGRDQGIFQYVAWAVSEGEVLYRDVRDVNGPVITMVHSLFQLLGGRDEHRFRVLDLFFTSCSFLIAGACVPLFVTGIDSAKPRRPPMVTHLSWAVATWVALSAQYLVYGFWDTAQRESFLDWFMLVSLVMFALIRFDRGDRYAKVLHVIAGALSFVPWLGKPTFAIFTLAQIVTLLFFSRGEPSTKRERLRHLSWFVGGGVLGALPALLFLLVRGDLRSFVKITFVDVPTMYRFIWPRPASAILFLPGYRTVAELAAATSIGLLLLIVLRRLPRRAIPIALMPALGLLSVVVQAKGFPYHFHPVTLGTTFGWVVAIAALWNWRAKKRSEVTIALRLAVVVGAIVVGARASVLASVAPYPDPPPASERDAASLESGARLAAFDRVDFFPRALRDAARYVETRTGPTDRVQTYGMDAYLLFLANRKSATPYVYAYDLNADAALAGSYDPGGIHPTEAESARIRALRDAHADDLLARLENAPPAAFVFIDRSPLMSYVDAVRDFAVHCPTAARWVAANYRQTADFEGIRVWLRNDVAEKPRPGRQPEKDAK